MSEEVKVESKHKLNKKFLLFAIIGIVVATIVAIALIVPNSVRAKEIQEQLSLGNKYLSELNYEQAEAIYLAILEIDPKCEEAYIGLANVYIATEQYEKAEEILRKAEEQLGETEAIKEKREELERKRKEQEEKLKPTVTNTPIPTATNTPTPQPTSTPTPTLEPTPTIVQASYRVEENNIVFFGEGEINVTVVDSALKEFDVIEETIVIVIEEGISEIKEEAFSYCEYLTEIEMPESIIHIEENSFLDCNNLTTVYVVKDSYAEQWAKEHGYIVIEKGLISEEITIIPQPTETLEPTILPEVTPTIEITITPQPTNTPTPTPKQIVIKELNKTMYVISTVNVRSGHSTNYDKIGSLNRGEEVKVTGQSEKTNWYRIDYKGKEGYVSNNYLQDNPLPKDTTTQSMSSIETILNNAPLNSKKSPYEPLNELIEQLLSEILNGTMTTYQKVKTCYDYLIENCSYGKNTAINDYVWIGDHFLYSMEDIKAYGMLVGFVGGCSDYSSAFAMIMQAIGLDCYIVEGVTSAAAGGYVYHIWCEMKIDGVIYVFDPQVEDNIAKGGTVKYYRFGKMYEQVPEKYKKFTYTPVEPEDDKPTEPIESEKIIIEGKVGDFVYIIENKEAKIVNFTDYDISEVIIPKKILEYPVTSIGASAFEGCSNLNKVELPEGLVSIEDKAFAFCESLIDVYIPSSVSSIGNDVFKDCDSLMITTPKKSYADSYAKENNIKRKIKLIS